MANTYDVNENVRLFATFRSTAGTPTDPTVVRFKYQSPGSTTVTRTYPTSITRSSTGVYYSDLTVSTAGQWIYQWDSSGVVRSSYEKSFRVRPGI
jgi:hypothetical protein